jgi:hypothetical protein
MDANCISSSPSSWRRRPTNCSCTSSKNGAAAGGSDGQRARRSPRDRDLFVLATAWLAFGSAPWNWAAVKALSIPGATSAT